MLGWHPQKTIYYFGMATLQDVERAVEGFTPAELEAFRKWFADHDAVAWDTQFATDVSRGKLDSLADEAIEDLRSGRSTEL